MRVISTIPFTIVRMLKNYIVLLLLLVVPILLITIFYFILGDMVSESGQPYLYENVISMLLVFQLFGGSIVKSYLYEDLFTKFGKRMRVLPFNITMYAFSIISCGTIYSIILGITLMIFSQFVIGVVLGNWLWMIYIISLMAVLSSIVSLILMFSVKSFKLAERLSELYGLGFILLAGMFFPLPDNSFFNFMGSYGNPLTLAMMSIFDMNAHQAAAAWQSANYLLLASVVLAALLLLIGRRRWR